MTCKLWQICLIVLASQVPAIGEDASPVTLGVLLNSGRRFVGQLEPRTDSKQLRLRFSRGRAAIERSIDWDEVAEIRQGTDLVSRAQILQMVDANKRKQPVANTDVQRLSLSEPSGSANTPSAKASLQESTPNATRSLSLQATPANWDSDVELDGLAVAVIPLDDRGEIAPVTGSLEVWLIGELPPGYLGNRNPRLGHWQVQVHAADFEWPGCVVRLPFQAAHPEFDFDLGAFAAAHGRLTVPGQGTFESTVTFRLRPYSGFRDRLQQVEGTRFLPGELHGRFE